MRKLGAHIAAFAAGVGLWSSAQAGTIIMGVYPDALITVSEQGGAITGRIKLETGLPTAMRLSKDKKRLYVSTVDHTGIEVIDVASRKVINSFTLDTETTRYRYSGGTPDPSGKYFYMMLTQIDKELDRYNDTVLKLAKIDLEQKKIVQSFDIPKAELNDFRGGRARFEVSPDGKYLYQFGDKVLIIDTATLKTVDRIELSKSDLPGFENMNFGAALDNSSDPNHFISVFSAPDQFRHSNVFGIANFDLTTRQYSFAPIGPAPQAMTGLQVAPNKKDAYVVVNTTLNFTNKRCEMWHFDLTTNVLKNKNEFTCKTRFSYGMSLDGKKLYIYGASYDLEVYDAATLKYEKTWDLQNDITGAGYVIVS